MQECKSAKRVKDDDQVGDKVLMQRTADSTRKLECPYDGPYEVTKVLTNGTVTIQKGIVNKRVNIRRIFLYRQKSNQGSKCNIQRGPIGLGQKEPYRIRVIYWIYGIRSPRLYRTRVLYWTYGIR